MKTILISSILSIVALQDLGAEPIIFRTDLPSELTRIEIPIKSTVEKLEGENNYWNYFQGAEKTINITESKDSTWEFTGVVDSPFIFEKIRIQLREANLNILNDQPHDRDFYEIKVTGMKSGNETILKEGIFLMNNSLPVELEEGEKYFLINSNGSSNDVPRIRYSFVGGTYFEGKLLVENAEVVIKNNDSLLTPSKKVGFTLTLDPIDPMFPTTTVLTAGGDIASLRDAQVVIEQIDPEAGSVKLAVLEGDLTVRPKEELAIGAAAPLFSRLDVIQRRYVGLDALTEKNTKPVLLVFGNFNVSPMHYGGQTANLPIGLTALKKQTESYPSHTLAVVSNTVSQQMFFGEWLDQSGFYLLMDETDVSRFNFADANQHGFYAGNFNQKAEVLSNLFDIPSQNIGIVLLDPQGLILYYNRNAQNNFTSSIQEALSLLTKSAQ